ncbi:MAG: T9SS type A sorting domain-containing protein [candidate division WOR-3 bacterium]|nr:MAG: T9SS type A sorting domain-containing protein [candidate division WOR-3 bacterium]
MYRTLLIVFICVCSIELFAQETGARYLIITHDQHHNVILPLAEWKTQKGMKAKVVKLSDIGSDSTQIRAFIINAYNTWVPRPEYLLLVGNKYQLPFPRVQGVEACYSDNYYTNLMGDFQNEMIPGRFWVSDSIEAKTVVAKVLSYEKNPFMDDSLWFRRGATIVNLDDPILPGDTNYWKVTRTAHQLMVNAGFNHIDSFVGYCWGPANFLTHDSLDVIEAINRGCSYLTYRGLAWGRWTGPFGDIYPSQMSNGLMLPIVVSATCATIEGIGREWLCAGTSEQPKGVVGFYGTTTGLSSASGQRSALMHGTITSIFRDSMSTLGKAAEQGRVTYWQLFNDSLDYDGWNCLGDPEMAVRTGTPRTLQVVHPEWIRTGICTTQVSVQCNSTPVESALVCVMAIQDTTVYRYGRTNAAGHIAFVDTVNLAGDSILITVTGRNTKPYCRMIRVYSVGSPYVILGSFQIDDSTGGNGDGIANPGEDLDMPVWLINWGDTTAYGVSAVIRKSIPDAFVTLNDTIKHCGDIPGFDSAYVADGFNIQIDSNCPDLHDVQLEISVTDAQDSCWVSRFNITVHAPVIIRKGHHFPGNLLYIVPGDTNQLTVELVNIGSYVAENTVGKIICNDSLLAVIDSLSSFGSILSGSTASNHDDPFIVSSDPQTPSCHPVSLQLEVTSGVYVDTLDCLIYVGPKDYYIWDPDPDHTSGPVIHEKLTALNYSGDYNTTFPYGFASIYRALFICSGEYWNNYVILDTSSAAEEIERFLNEQGGKVYLEGGLVWRTDPLSNGGYDFCPLFSIEPQTTTNGYISWATGCSGTFTQDMVFTYQGGAITRDYLYPTGGSDRIFLNMPYNLGLGVAANNKTIGVSFELGELVDAAPPSSKLVLVDSIMQYFGIEPTGIQEHQPAYSENIPFLHVHPNPSRGIVDIECDVGQYAGTKLELGIYDVSGRLVKNFALDATNIDQQSAIRWDCRDAHDRKLSTGVYFVRLATDDFAEIKKIVFLR